ncbi:MAG: phosphotransferase family protein [Halanaerobiales bacterium]
MELSEIEKRIQLIFGSCDKIEAIGNHHLKRHLVHRFFSKNKYYVMKLYFVKNRWNREVASLRFFKNTEILAPIIDSYGIFEDGIEWMIYEYQEGVLLSEVVDEIPERALNELYYQLGRQLGLIHTYREFDFFGSMNEKGISINGFKTYRAYFEYRMETFLEEIFAFKHEKPGLIRKSLMQIKSMYSILDEVQSGHLCHNDFDERNILIDKIEGQYELKAIIDFEQCVPDDPDKELIYFYLPLKKGNRKLSEQFRSGYEEYRNIDEDRLLYKKDFYYLFKGIGICAWSKDVDYEYYLRGISFLENALDIS